MLPEDDLNFETRRSVLHVLV